MKNIFNKPTKIIVISFFVLMCSTMWAQNKAVPQRIISLGAASTEILYKVGAGSQIVAVTDVCNYPEEAKNLPVLGQFGGASISTESLLSCDPDLVILYSGMHDYLLPALNKYEIPYYISNAASIADVITEIKTLATMTGHEKEGLKLEKEYNAQLKAIQKKNSTKQKKTGGATKVYWEVWYEPFMSAGKNSFINDVIKIAGGQNIFGNEEQAYPVVSEETIIAANPDLILIPSDIFVDSATVKARRGWNEISAVKNDNVIIFNADIYTRPGPRIFEAIKELNEMLY